jgi:hypothetical protein
MNKKILFVIIVLVLASFACSIQNVKMRTIETQEVEISEPLPTSDSETELVFKMAGGKFLIHPGAQGLVDGTIIYNVEQWEPEFTRRNNAFKITQVDSFRLSGIPAGDVVNLWDLKLTNTLPLNITITGGASQNEYNFSGLKISQLAITQGASETDIRFDIPNSILMQSFTFSTGASSAEIYGLLNANFEKMSMSAGAGNYKLDFSGFLTHDVHVEIKAGVSNISISVPSDIQVVVNNKGTISNINTSGTWLVSDTIYRTLNDGYTLTIDLNMALGNVNLKQQ